MKKSHKNPLPPRACYLTELLTVEQQRPLSLDLVTVDTLPAEVKLLTGSIRFARPMKQDGPCLVLFVEAEQGMFVLKVAKGRHRSQELWAEHTAMQLLHSGPVPVPRSLVHACYGDLSFQLRRHCPGEPLSAVLTSDDSTRADAIRQMGTLLACIHATDLAEAWTWEEWISASLEQAARNMAAGVCDPEEFASDEPPTTALDWLLANRPARGGPVCLLHGDYRPKNILWENGKIASVIDWQFVDIGDPYYDLGIIHWYMRDEAEWQQFLNAYGLSEFDQERFEFCGMLQKFLNV